MRVYSFAPRTLGLLQADQNWRRTSVDLSRSVNRNCTENKATTRPTRKTCVEFEKANRNELCLLYLSYLL